MNYMQKNLEFTTYEEGVAQLKDAVAIRDQMGGAMYWSILNEDCCEIANAIRAKYGRKEEIGQLLGEGNYK